jgi:hypothetical protein
MPDQPPTFLTTRDLGDRWRTSAKAIAQLRHRGETPPAVKIGGRLLYRIEDVIAFEQARHEADRAAS